MPNVSYNRKISDFGAPKRSWGSTLEIIVFIALSVLVYIYLVSPKRTEYSDKKDQLTKLEQDEAKVKRQKQVFESLVTKLENSQSDVAKLDEVMPLDSRISSLYILTEYLTQQAGMTSSSVAIESDSKTVVSGDKEIVLDKYGADRQLTTTKVTVNAIGSLDQLTNFLGKLENSNRIIDVTNVEIGQGKDNQFIFKVLANAYAYAPKPKTEDTAGRSVPPPVVNSPQ